MLGKELCLEPQQGRVRSKRETWGLASGAGVPKDAAWAEALCSRGQLESPAAGTQAQAGPGWVRVGARHLSSGAGGAFSPYGDLPPPWT